MRAFAYARPGTLEEALAALREPGADLLAGGTELLNWMKDGIEAPRTLLDITGLPLGEVAAAGDGGLRIGAVAKMSHVAAHPLVRDRYPVVRESLLQAASPQLRNMATIGGNLMQRTRCPYYRAEDGTGCNRRVPGSGCAALESGDTSAHAIFGWSPSCVATLPSDLAVALAALDAELVTVGDRGERRIPVAEFHRLPGEEPARHNELPPGELIVAVVIPPPPDGEVSRYLKVRERASYGFAVVSAAAAVVLDGSGAVAGARVALGGVAHRPWRLTEAESALRGVPVQDAVAVRAAVERSFAQVDPPPGNGVKVELAQRAAVRALQMAGGAA
ncbi:FAD binding domain-containing protein [Actinomadura rupiterrae]|uniref:FAD binding domain-containing protein n=1 Tax=Actinomadura rupiterrae TaxID=559627 RepID=UPI0020A3EFAF|nr:xanthine dehydrogenase family protein subunit M [Actinomadura rupiterrae]MCP2341501.1 xanthine dehydrogenase YagS FAD-binding subunit [Actinomadura rupiterrae]